MLKRYDPLANPDQHPWGHAILTLAIGGAVGASLGAISNKPCTSKGGYDEIFCGPGPGAAFGAATGLAATSIGALLVGLVSPGKREASFKTAGLGLGLFAALAAVGAVRQATKT